jgi:hypothetical protein
MLARITGLLFKRPCAVPVGPVQSSTGIMGGVLKGRTSPPVPSATVPASAHSKPIGPLARGMATVAAILVLAFLSDFIAEAQADDFLDNYIVVVDENGNLTSYYLHDYRIGVEHTTQEPSTTKPPTWNGTLGYTVYAGDFAMSDPQGNAPSDVIRFPEFKKDSAGNGISKQLQFYSDTSDTDSTKSNDTTPPATSAKPQPEVELGKLPDKVVKAPNDQQGGVDPKLDFTGRWGTIYRVGSGLPGVPGSGTRSANTQGPTAYVFISDTDVIKSSGRSVHYDASSRRLSFSNDIVTDTGSPGDPLVGSAVNMPAFRLRGLTPDGRALFDPVGGAQFTLGLGGSTYLKATVSDLEYLRSDSLFSATLSHVSVSGVDSASPLYDPNLAPIDSTFLHYLDTVYNPASGLFDPNASLSITYTPDGDFYAQTSGFSVSGESSLTNVIAVGSLPEPSSWLLLVFGVAAVTTWRAIVRRRLGLASIRSRRVEPQSTLLAS